jgi:HK97 family phage major capsid protein
MSDQIIEALEKVENKFQSYNYQQAEFADRLLNLEQKSTTGHFDAPVKSAASLGSNFIKAFESSRELFEKTRSVRLEVKAATDAVTTASGRNLVMAGVGAPSMNVLGFQNALVTRPSASTTAVEYSRYIGQQGAAAVQATEGAAKAQLRPDHQIITQSAITIAGFTKMSRQAMNDSQEMKRVVDTVLTRSVGTQLDIALTTGVATPLFDGFATLATPYTSLVYQSLPDAVSEGVAAMQLAGFEPDVVVLNPSNWLAVTVAKGTSNDHYLSGSYLGVMPMQMRGLRVVLSPSIPAGKAFMMDSNHSELLAVEGFSIEVAYSGDDFTRNLVSVLGEMRVIPVFRTAGSARLITPKA